MTEDNLEPIYQDIWTSIDQYEDEALAIQERINRDDIVRSLDNLGYDTEAAGDRLKDVLTILVEGNEWDVAHSIGVMDALEDDSISEDELLTIFTIQGIEDVINVVVDDTEDTSRERFKEIDDAIDTIIVEIEEDTEEFAYENIPFFARDFVFALNWSIDMVAERLEAFIANMMGVELEE